MAIKRWPQMVAAICYLETGKQSEKAPRDNTQGRRDDVYGSRAARTNKNNKQMTNLDLSLGAIWLV